MKKDLNCGVFTIFIQEFTTQVCMKTLLYGENVTKFERLFVGINVFYPKFAKNGLNYLP